MTFTPGGQKQKIYSACFMLLRLGFFHLAIYYFCYHKHHGFSAFVVFLIIETQTHLVAVAAGALAVLGDSSTEAGHTAARHTEVTLRTVAWREKDEKKRHKAMYNLTVNIINSWFVDLWLKNMKGQYLGLNSM